MGRVSVRLVDSILWKMLTIAFSAPPPINTKPEAIGLPTQTYSMSRDTKLFKPPKSYPEAPKNMYYEVPPVQPVPKKPPPIFPWEEYAPKPTRVFLDESRETDPRVGEPASLPTASSSDPATAEEERYLTPTKRSPSVDPWKSYTLSNAWDEVPEIERYVEAINRSRKPKTQVLSGNKTRTPDPSVQEDSAARKPSMKITDFPTELERPSLPVTPAAIRRTSFWGEEQEESAELPTAEGVPEQEDWVRLTLAAFLNLLGATYLFWETTEPRSKSAGTSTPPNRVLRK